MMKYVAFFALIAVCLADHHDYRPAPYHKHDHYDDPKYQFRWTVKDDYSYNNYGQEESRDGDNTDGVYWVALPDGRLQTVKYYVNGDSGYVADVSYSREPKYEEAASYHRPTYTHSHPHTHRAYKPAPYTHSHPHTHKAYKPARYTHSHPHTHVDAYKPASYAHSHPHTHVDYKPTTYAHSHPHTHVDYKPTTYSHSHPHSHDKPVYKPAPYAPVHYNKK